MSFCAICGRYHESETGCFGNDLGVTADQEAGNEKSRNSTEEFKIVAQQADRFIVKLLLFGLGGIAVLMILAALLRR